MTAGEAGRIGIQVTKTLRGVFMGGNGLEAFERVQVSAEQHNETVRITVRQPSSRIGGHVVTVALAIQVPAQCRLDLEVDAGSVEINGVSSEISGRVDAGNLTARGVTFMERSEARVDAGNITIDGALGEAATLDVRVDAGNARLTLPQRTDATLDAQVDAGSISIDGWNVEYKREFMSARRAGRSFQRRVAGFASRWTPAQFVCRRSASVEAVLGGAADEQTPAIRAVIFDVGGVLIQTVDRSALCRWEARFGLREGALAREVFSCPASWRAGIGLATGADVWMNWPASTGYTRTRFRNWRRTFSPPKRLMKRWPGSSSRCARAIRRRCSATPGRRRAHLWRSAVALAQ